MVSQLQHESIERQRAGDAEVIVVGIQGGLGSFHHQAADILLSEVESVICPFNTFPDLFYSLSTGEVDYAVLALENTIAGFIHTNYALMHRSRASIVGETYLPVQHCLLGPRGVLHEEIKEIQAHPMAILQCLDFLAVAKTKGIRIVDCVDSALGAGDIAENPSAGIAIIAPAQVAERYALDILQYGIESSANNFTRFVGLVNHTSGRCADIAPGERAKATLSVTVKAAHSELPQMMQILTRNGVDIDLLLPLAGQPGESRDYILEITCEDVGRIGDATSTIEKLGFNLQILGIYASRS